MLDFNTDFKPISDSCRFSDMKESIVWWNQNFALNQSDILVANIKNDMRADFQFPFLLEGFCKIKGGMAAPHEIVV